MPNHAANRRVEDAQLQIGYTKAELGKNADAQIGAVKVGGDWIASYLLVGVNAGSDGLVGTADDIKLAGDYGAGPVKDSTTLSTIASVTIGGQVMGTPDSVSSTDHFGFVAEQIDAFSVGGFAISLHPGPHNDVVNLGAAGDVTLSSCARIFVSALMYSVTVDSQPIWPFDP